MSHIVTLQTQIKNTEILKKVCEKQGIQCRIGGNVTEELYSGKVNGIASFRLEGWQYPAVVQEGGKVVFDNFNGRWGDIQRLDKVCQEYAVDLTVDHYENEGYRLVEQRVEADGTIELELVN